MITAMNTINSNKIKRLYFIFLNIVSILIIVGLFSCGSPKSSALTRTILRDTNSYFFVDVENYPKKKSRLPVGVFDSGTGGLTVLDAIVNYDCFDNSADIAISGGDGIPDFQQEFFISFCREDKGACSLCATHQGLVGDMGITRR